MRSNSVLVGVLALLVTASGGLADRPDRQETRLFTWPRLREEGKLVSGELLPVATEGWQNLRIENVGLAGTRIPIVVLDHVSPTVSKFAVEGQIRYENVEGEAYLEACAVLPDGRRFITRTVADSGPLQRIAGASDWRPFSLPFDLMLELPDRVILEINVFMPGAGLIEISPLRMVNLSPDLFRANRGWWSRREASWVPVVVAMPELIICGLVAFLTWKGAPRFRLVTALFLLMLTYGVACTVVGIIAVIDDQPYHVYFSLLLIGVMWAVAAPIVQFVSLRYCRRVELRRMQALDAQ